ncbi:nodulin MtN21 /EamA-like transporter family protein [Perilla frutescens var. frutescens]|nr:nodulin MtN21 /EamA-like transporter family protein [Perilla frutescens var. frutescens]
MKMRRESMQLAFEKAKPFLGVVFLQAGLAGMDIISKAALNEGMSNYVFVVYRHAVATLVIAPFAFILDKKIRPRMTISTFLKIMLLSLLEPVIDQNLYFLGMKYTTATFAAAMANVLPAITFVMAWCFRIEKVKFMSVRSQAKIMGTLGTVAGAMIMTLVRGPNVEVPWSRGGGIHEAASAQVSVEHSIKGALFITIGCFSWAAFMILQSVTLRTYPAELSLTAWICFLGTAEGAALALLVEKGNPAAWSIQWDTKFLAAVYSGIFCSGIAYYVQGVVMKQRGPVFVTAFSPLSMIIVAIMSSFILAEKMFLGRIVGAAVIVMGLYFVVWGKQKDYKSPSMEQVEEEIIPVAVKQTKVISSDDIIVGVKSHEEYSSTSKLEVSRINVEDDERLV